MLDFFKKKEAETKPDNQPDTPAVTAPPAAGIPFHPELIDELVADHRRLFELHDAIRAHFAAGDLATVALRLKEFGVFLCNHLLTENMRLYIYLQQHVADDEINTALVRSFRKEMDGIAKAALAFLDKYATLEKRSVPELETFLGELNQIGTIMQERMQREEGTLYPLYAASY